MAFFSAYVMFSPPSSPEIRQQRLNGGPAAFLGSIQQLRPLAQVTHHRPILCLKLAQELNFFRYRLGGLLIIDLIDANARFQAMRPKHLAFALHGERIGREQPS